MNTDTYLKKLKPIEAEDSVEECRSNNIPTHYRERKLDKSKMQKKVA